GGGMVKVHMRGDATASSVEIEPSLFDEDRDLLPDLIAAAINDATRKLAEARERKQRELLAGMPLPPGFSL
ncbi:MAG: YbaB/EbfC family nucleoid-associated protein, partial [Mariprofundaceae bacterium]